MIRHHTGSSLNTREINSLVNSMRGTDNHTNLRHLAVDYLTLAVVLAATIAFCELRAGWGISWWWNVPVVTLAVFIIGGVQHRFAGLGHEAAHYILFKNRLMNELVSDLFCMFPLFATTAHYRPIHLGHHDYVNDWKKDPELTNLGRTRLMDRFPMPVQQFIKHFHLRLFWPPGLMQYVWKLTDVISLGNGLHPYPAAVGKQPHIGPMRVTTVLGLAYIVAMVVVLRLVAAHGALAAVLLAPLGVWALGSAVVMLLPRSWFFQSHFKAPYSVKTTSVMRLGYYTLIEAMLSLGTFQSGQDWGIYFWLLWVLPLLTTWPWYALLRDMYQHANADDGKLTNSRVLFSDPITRWALFIYGQDMHLTHHLFPAVPHYNLRRLHAQLMDRSPEYAEHVVECHGIFHNAQPGKPTVLEVMAAQPRATSRREF